MKIVIRKLTRKPMTTKFGDTEKLLIQAEDGQFFDSWKAAFNQSWTEGQTIEIPESQIKSREWEGETYKTIAPPPKEGFSQSQVDIIKPVLDEIKKINDRLDQMLKIVGFSESPAEEPPNEELNF